MFRRRIIAWRKGRQETADCASDMIAPSDLIFGLFLTVGPPKRRVGVHGLDVLLIRVALHGLDIFLIRVALHGLDVFLIRQAVCGLDVFLIVGRVKHVN